MRRALVVTVLVGLSGAASAGTFLGLGIGPSPATGNDAPDNVITFSENGRSGRILGGYRLSKFSAEASITAYSLTNEGKVGYDAIDLALAGKYNHPLGGGFEAFGKLGVHHVSIGNSTDQDRSGNGWLLGAGFEYQLKLPFAAGSVFVEYAYSTATIEESAFTRGYSTRLWMLGATVGL